MATKWYLRSTTPATVPTAGEKSTTQPVAASNWGTSPTTRALSTTKGSSATTVTGSSNATTSAQNGCLGRWCTIPLQAGTYGSGTWTLALQSQQSNAAGNWFHTQSSIYFWRPSNSSVVGFVVDSDTSVGVEFSNNGTGRYGQVLSVTGANVTIQDGDILVIEVWAKATQGMGSSYTISLHYEGTTDVTAAYTGTDPASYIQAPANIPEILNVDGGNAAGTGTSYTAPSTIAIYPPVTSGTGSSDSAGPNVGSSAGLGSGTGEAYVGRTDMSVFPPVTTGTGTAESLLAQLDVYAGLVNATGSANDAEAQVANIGPAATEVASASSTTTGTTLGVTATATFDVGDIALILIGADNAGAAGASSITGVSDTAGNTWGSVGGTTVAPGSAANDGATIAVWMTTVSTQIVGSDTITVSFSPTTVSKAAKLYKVINVSSAYAVATATGQGDS